MRKMIRVLGITCGLGLAILTTADALEPTCYIECTNGATWQGVTNSYSKCCEQFWNFCQLNGTAYWTIHGGPRNYCPVG